MRAIAGIIEHIETRTMQECQEADDMTLGEQEGKDENGDEQERANEPDDEFGEQTCTTITDEDYIYNVVIKNGHDEESCQKCTRKKIKNGVICKSCKRAFHSERCSGLTQEQTKNEAAKEKIWICCMCTHSNKNCPCCLDKDKEIKNSKN